MPLYLFVCSCENEFEKIIPIEDRDSTVFICPKCKSEVKRAVTSANFGKPKHQTKAILADGSHVSGTWVK